MPRAYFFCHLPRSDLPGPIIVIDLVSWPKQFIFITDPKAEYYIPTIVTDLINDGRMAVKVITTTDTWFGVTYKEDKPMAVAAIAEQIDKGVYPKPLWGWL